MNINNMTRRAAFVAITDEDNDENIDKITSYCERCKDFGFYHLLGPRIYPNKDEPIPYDSDKWLMCYNCGQITPRVHAKQLNEIGPIVDPPDTIHDSNIVTALTLGSHKKRQAMIERNKKNKVGYNRSRDYVDVDSDIRSQVQKGKQLTSYSSTNDEFEG